MPYHIPVENLGRFKATLAKLARRAERLGCPEITYEIVGSEVVPVTSNGKVVGHREVKLVEVTGETPVIPGWSFLAVIDFSSTDGNGFVVRAAPGVELPAAYREALVPGHCDHCQAVRRRKETFIVLRVESGEYRQVGRQCLAAYTGHQNPDAVAAYFSMLDTLVKSLDEGEFSGGGYGGELLREVETFLAVVCGVVRQDGGFLSRAQAELRNPNFPPPTTADKAWRILNPVGGEERRLADEWYTHRAEYRERDEDLAAKILEFIPSMWAGDDGEINQYLFNLRSAVQSGFVGFHTAGLVASAYLGYARHLEDLDRAKLANSRHVGEPKQRVNLDLVCLSVSVRDTDYGPSTTIKFRDQHHNAFTWFASGRKDDEFRPGQTFSVKGTVKGHGEYKGVKETYLTRVVVTGQPTLKGIA